MELWFLKEDLVQDPNVALERASNGAAYLDGLYGPEWDQQIDLDKLDIRSPCRCVLARLYRSGRPAHLMSPRNGVDRGFSTGLLTEILAMLMPIPPLKKPYAVLTEAWRAVIRERRESRILECRTGRVRLSRKDAPLRGVRAGSTSAATEHTLAT